MPPDALLGPGAALVGAIIVVTAMYRLVREFIADLMKQRDVAITGWREADATMDRMAAAIEVQNRDAAMRTRRSDR